MTKATTMTRVGLGAVALTLTLLWASAAAAAPRHEGYLTTPYGEQVRNAYGECWRMGDWTPEMAIPECEGAQPVARAVAPRAVIATLRSHALFDFDRAAVRQESARRMQDELLVPMGRAAEVRAVRVVGHTDRIGSETYNQALSERRAAAVATYLASQGVASRVISTEGRGESEPVVACDEVRGREGRGNRALVQCLQPNRRAEVEVDVLP